MHYNGGDDLFSLLTIFSSFNFIYFSFFLEFPFLIFYIFTVNVNVLAKNLHRPTQNIITNIRPISFHKDTLRIPSYPSLSLVPLPISSNSIQWTHSMVHLTSLPNRSGISENKIINCTRITFPGAVKMSTMSPSSLL